MAEDWIMCRLPRRLVARLALLAERRERARQAGHPAHQDRADREPYYCLVEMLLNQYDRHAMRRSACKARQRARRRSCVIV